MTPPPLAAHEAALLLGVSTARIRQLCLSGRLVGATKTFPSRRGAWRVPREALSAYMTWRAMARALRAP
jgi:DNA-binding transcriptional regulator YdaS (Cro superfamily)